MKLFSPAKINLFLRVLKKREDGYHDLASLFQAVELGDTITLAFSERDHFTCNEPSLLWDETNLLWKALELFRKKTALLHPVTLHLEKKIPFMAGLGGGSSNGATLLWGLQKLFELELEDALLAAWAAEIGSDLSFFFSFGRAYCTGRGEHVEPLEKPLHPPSLWLVKIPEGLSTALIFKNLHLHSCSQIPPEEILKKNLGDHLSFLNDLEEPAFRLLPQLQALKGELIGQGFTVSMTGSGTGLLCLGEKTPQLPPSITCTFLRYAFRHPGSWYSLPS